MVGQDVRWEGRKGWRGARKRFLRRTIAVMAGESDTLFSSEESEKDALKGILSGRFIVLDGPDGSGKSTQFRRLSSLC